MKSYTGRRFLVFSKILSDRCFCGRSLVVLYCVLNGPQTAKIDSGFGCG